MRPMRICIGIEGSDDASSSWSGNVYRWLGENKYHSLTFFCDNLEHPQTMPLDCDLYLLHGYTKAPIASHIQPIQIMRFGAPFPDAYCEPLDRLSLDVSGTFGKDHGNLGSDAKREIEKRMTLIEKMPRTQFHLSLNGNLDGVWEPRIPVGDHDANVLLKPKAEPRIPDDILHTETHAPRICTSPTIAGCFYGIYPNIHREFEDPKCTHMDFFVYVASNFDPKHLMEHEEIVKNKIVWDAHLSLEANIFGSARMTLLDKMVRFYPQDKSYTDRKYHNWIRPYDDPSEPEEYHSPIAEYRWKEG